MSQRTPKADRIGLFAIILVAAVLTAATGRSEDGSPSVARLTGFGDAKFGSSIEDARKVWPGMQAIGDHVKLPSAAFSSVHLQRFLMKDHKLDGLSAPVDVEFRFWKERLWAFVVYFKPEDRQAAAERLERIYGPRTTGTEARPIWRGEKVSLQSMLDAGWYGATDNAISEDAREWFFKALTGHGQEHSSSEHSATPETAASPAPTAVNEPTAPASP